MTFQDEADFCNPYHPATPSHAENLVRLRVENEAGNEIAEKGLEAIAGSSTLGKLKILEIPGCVIPKSSATALEASPVIKGLKHFDQSENMKRITQTVTVECEGEETAVPLTERVPGVSDELDALLASFRNPGYPLNQVTPDHIQGQGAQPREYSKTLPRG